MKKEEALKQFLEHEVKSISSKFVYEAMSNISKAQKKVTVEHFCASLCQVLREAPELYFLQITLIRTRALVHKPFYRLEAYGADLYLSEPLLETELELAWLYHAYERFSETLEEESRKYILQIGKPELERIKLAELCNCQRIVKHLFLESVGSLLQSEDFMKLDVEKNFQFHLSQYRGPYEILMTKSKNLESMGGWLCELLQTEGGS